MEGVTLNDRPPLGRPGRGPAGPPDQRMVCMPARRSPVGHCHAPHRPQAAMLESRRASPRTWRLPEVERVRCWFQMPMMLMCLGDTVQKRRDRALFGLCSFSTTEGSDMDAGIRTPGGAAAEAACWLATPTPIAPRGSEVGPRGYAETAQHLQWRRRKEKKKKKVHFPKM